MYRQCMVTHMHYWLNCRITARRTKAQHTHLGHHMSAVFPHVTAWGRPPCMQLDDSRQNSSCMLPNYRHIEPSIKGNFRTAPPHPAAHMHTP